MFFVAIESKVENHCNRSVAIVLSPGENLYLLARADVRFVSLTQVPSKPHSVAWMKSGPQHKWLRMFYTYQPIPIFLSLQ